MKKGLSIFLFISAFVSVNAQQHFDPFGNNKPDKHRAFINGLLMRQAMSAQTAQKPTGLQQRLMAQAIINAAYEVQDTMTYKYSGGRGSRYNHNRTDNFGYRDNFTSDYLSGPYFEMSVKKNDVLADSIVKYSGLVPITVSTAFYGVNNRVDSFFSFYNAGPTPTTSKTIQAYDADGNMTQYAFINDYMLPPDFDTGEMRRLWYNTARTHLQKDTVYIQAVNDLQPYYTNIYHYNNQDDLDSIVEYEIGGGAYDLLFRTTIFYDAGNRVNKVVKMDYSPFGASTSVDTFGYTGNLPFFTFYERRRYEGGFDYSGVRITKHIGNNDLPDSIMVYIKDGGSFDLRYILKYSYNSFHNPDSIVVRTAAGAYAGRYNFYYETYDGSVGVAGASPANKLKLYPNPFSDKIRVAWHNGNAQVKISLLNAIGQTIFTRAAYLSTGDNSIQLPGIPNGSYMLIIQDDKGNIYSSRIVRQ